MADEQLFEKLYTQLNTAQKSAVDTVEGPVVVNAGPGTGKTQILTLRIANILREQGADMAENILALTFTHAGVTAMRERLASIIGADAYRVGIYTFHSFAEHVIRSREDVFIHFLSSQLISDVERLETIEQSILEGEYTILKPFAAPDYFVKPVLAAIDELKRDAISPEKFSQWNEEFKKSLLESEDSYYKRNGTGYEKGDIKKDALKKYEKNLELADLYAEYESALEHKKFYDYNDLIVKVIDKIETDTDFKYELQEKYQYILLDEQQDSNAGQNRIVELLCDAAHVNGRPNLFTVGDDKQAIYRFQGASLENFLSFENKYTDVAVINLKENYRSGQEILDVSHSLIEKSSNNREPQKLNSNRNNTQVEVHEFTSYSDELDYIARETRRLIDEGISKKEIAILYRENRHTDDIQKVLARYDVPSVVMARENILQTPLVYKILLLLRAVQNLNDNYHLTNLLYSNVFITSTYDVLRIVERFRRNKRDKETGAKSLFRVIQDKKILKDIGVGDVDSFFGIAGLLQLAHTNFASTHFMEAFDELMLLSGVLDNFITNKNSHNQLRYYERLYEDLRALLRANPRAKLGEVVDHFETLEKYDISLDANPSEHADGVRLLTAHKSKGLEYDHVFVSNMVDKVWGNKTTSKQFKLPTGGTRGEEDDERRLLYVAITRSRTRCVLSCARHNGERATDPSQFLYDLGDSVLTWENHNESINPELRHTPIDLSINNSSLLEDELIRSIYAKRALSVTALNNYLNCPARYFVNNLLQVPATYSRSLVYGSLIHRALELFFRKSQEKGEVLPKEDLLKLFSWVLDQEYMNEHEHRDMHDKGNTSLGGYYEQYASTWNLQVENEMRINGVQLALADNTLTLTGVLDKVEKMVGADTIVRVVDYKTGKTFSEKSKEQKVALERQIVFYALLLDLYRDGYFQMSSGVLDFVEPNSKKGNYELQELSPSTEDKQALVAEIQKMDADIRKGSSFLEKRCSKKDCQACRLVNLLVQG